MVTVVEAPRTYGVETTTIVHALRLQKNSLSPSECLRQQTKTAQKTCGCEPLTNLTSLTSLTKLIEHWAFSRLPLKPLLLSGEHCPFGQCAQLRLCVP